MFFIEKDKNIRELTHGLGGFDLNQPISLCVDSASCSSQWAVYFFMNNCHDYANFCHPKIMATLYTALSVYLSPVVRSYCRLWPFQTLFTFHLLSTPAANLPHPLTGNKALDRSPPLHTLTYTLPHLLLVFVLPKTNPFYALCPSPLIRCLAQPSYSFSLLARTALHLNTFKDSLLKRKYPLTTTKILPSLTLPVH